MKSSYIFVKINSEKVKILGSSFDCGSIVLYDIVKIGSGFGGDWADLLVAARVARDEKNRNPFDL
jgi:hypothetical protein